MTMSQIGKLSSSSHSQIGVSWSDGVIRLRDEELFGKQPSQHLCVTFLHRVFALAEVRSVEIIRDQSTAEIHLEPDRFALSQILERLATSIHSQIPVPVRHFPTISILETFRNRFARSRSDGLARCSRPGTSSMNSAEGYGSAMRPFAATGSRESNPGNHARCSGRQGLCHPAPHRQRGYSI